MKQLQCLLLKSGKVAAGFVEEQERVYRVEGFYLEMEVGEQMSGSVGTVRGKLAYKAFSPVGGLVSTLDIPKGMVEGFQHLPVGVEHSMRYMLDAEVRNAERKRQLMARTIPGRVGISPEDYLAANAKYIAENGKLPQGPHVARDGIITGGTFNVVPTSPYRESQNDQGAESSAG